MVFPTSSPSTPNAGDVSAPTADGSNAAFAEAINARFSRSGTAPALVPLSPALPASQAPPPSFPPLSSTSISSMVTVANNTRNADPKSFTEITPVSLPTVLKQDGILVLDIRPHNAYSLGRLPNALSLSVPSTLLKRPGFSLSKLTQMLPSVTARDRFSRWHQAARIVVYDADSSGLNEGGNVLGLLRKFRNEGYTHDVGFVKGGFHAVWREMPSIVDSEPPPREEDDDGAPAMSKSMSAPAGAPTLRTKHLFSQPPPPLSQRRMHSLSLSQSHPDHLGTQVIPPTPMLNRADPFSTFAPSLPSTSSLRLPSTKEGVATTAFPQYPNLTSLPTLSPQPGLHLRPHYNSLPPAPAVSFNPFFDNVRQNLELRHPDVPGNGGNGGVSVTNGGIPLKLPRRVRRRLGELPFEWLRQIARRSGKMRGMGLGNEIGKEESTGVSETEESDAMDSAGSNSNSGATSPTNSSSEDLTRALASQFYKIELGEQKRLMGVMEHHSKESGAVLSSPHPTGVPVSGPPTSSMALMGSTLSAPGYRLSAMVGTGATRSVSYSGPMTGPVTGVGAFPAIPTIDPTLGRPQPELGVLGDKHERSVLNEAMKGKAREGEGVTTLPIFPYSITAGIEKGTKNRYRNIWPFEHARVRLLRKLSGGEEDDYMNASYVQPLGTTKRYIATQGPLPATFNDFWTLCWEQNVHVIVMLTREIESATVKCGNYWVEGSYGPFELKLLETNDTPEQERKRRESETASGFFNLSTAPPKPKPSKSRPKHKDKGKATSGSGQFDDAVPHTIRRVFSLTHTGYPSLPSRTVTQLQYLDWPDMNVPDDPRGLLQLIREVENAVASSRSEGDAKWGEGPLRRVDVERYANAVRSHYSAVPSVVPDSSLGAREEDAANKVHSGGVGPDDGVSGQDEVDPKTGIARHALGNPPVLLHCSAGVGRTGGFIAVDAVLDGIRRDMRKRNEARQAQTGVRVRESSENYQLSSGLHSPSRLESSTPPRETTDSRSSSNGDGIGAEVETSEAMEVDSSSSPSPPRVRSSTDVRIQRGEDDAAAAAAATMTVPVAVGQNEVHVPVAGFSVPMDVDSQLPPPTPAVIEPARPGMHRNTTVQASPELVSEVKRATMLNRRLSAASQQIHHHHHHGHHHHQPHPHQQGQTTASSVSSPHMEIQAPFPHVAAITPGATPARTTTVGGMSSRASEVSSSDSNSYNSRRSMSQTGSGTGSASFSFSQFGSGAGSSRTGSGHFSESPVPSLPSQTGSATSLLMAAKTAGLSLGGQDSPGSGEDVQAQRVVSPLPQTLKSVPTPSSNESKSNESKETVLPSGGLTAKSKGPSTISPIGKKSSTLATAAGSAASRLDDWRSEVRNSQAADGDGDEPPSRHSSDDSRPTSSRENSDDSVYTRSRAMALPRRLHDDSTPPLLSTYDEPIKRIVEDMRQQRMSLCQSLRQYVFVHQAILEGALMIVDEEKENQLYDGQRSVSVEMSDAEMKRRTSPMDAVPSHDPFFPLGGQSQATSSASSLGAAFVLKEEGKNTSAGGMPSIVDHKTDGVGQQPGVMVSPGRAKRGASPTELLKEGTSGEVLLTKRPSIKRRPRSSDEEDPSPRLSTLVLSSPPPPHSR